MVRFSNGGRGVEVLKGEKQHYFPENKHRKTECKLSEQNSKSGISFEKGLIFFTNSYVNNN